MLAGLRNKKDGPGLIIEPNGLRKGLNRYILRRKQEPEWIQGGEVTLPDG